MALRLAAASWKDALGIAASVSVVMVGVASEAHGDGGGFDTGVWKVSAGDCL